MNTPTLDKLAELERERQKKTEQALTNANKRRGPIATILAAIGIALAKAKGVLVLLLSKLKFLWVGIKLLKFSKYALTVTSMVATALIYAERFGWLFGVGLVALIFVHELGHGVAAKRLGLNVGLPIFIPFFGAFIALRETPKTPWVNSVIGAGGPIFGTLGGIVVTAVALSGLVAPPYNELLLAVAYLNFSINFFNLLTIFGLDGDRITAPLRAWQLGTLTVLIAGIGYLTFKYTGFVESFLPFIVFLLFIKMFRVAGKSKASQSALQKLESFSSSPGDELVTEQQRWCAYAMYLGLAVVLAFGSAFTHYLLVRQ